MQYQLFGEFTRSVRKALLPEACRYCMIYSKLIPHQAVGISGKCSKNMARRALNKRKTISCSHSSLWNYSQHPPKEVSTDPSYISISEGYRRTLLERVRTTSNGKVVSRSQLQLVFNWYFWRGSVFRRVEK